MTKQEGAATHIAQALELGDIKAKYDAEVKNILSDKVILAWILKYTVRELQDYDSIKKVYSIWICMEAPNYAADTITEYHLVPDKLSGDYVEEAKYDLLSVVMICMGKDVIYEEQPSLQGLLSVVLSHRLGVEEKKRILEHTYGIAMTEKLEKEMNLMCNLSDLIEERGIVKAERGAAIQMLKDGVKPEKIVTYLSTLTLSDVEKIATQF